jgi:tetratricopeptide (TPR) repeat protein
MPSPTTPRLQAATIPDRQGWGLDEGILTEPIPGSAWVALWLPGPPAEGYQSWERIAPSGPTGFVAGPGIRAAPATLVRVRQRVAGFFAQLFRRGAGYSWSLPNGRTGEQVGPRQTDLLLVWAEDATVPLEAQWVQARWPEGDRVQRLGKNLYLVLGVNQAVPGSPAAAPAAAAAHPEEPLAGARLEVERSLAAARALHDRRREASALADLGVIYLHQSQIKPAITTLGQALALARQVEDQARESDILGNLGLVTLAAGDARRAREIFALSLEAARRAGDRFAEKMALERIGVAHTRTAQPAEAVAAFDEALTLARAVGHRKHEADLLWYLGIAHAEGGQRDLALARAQASIRLMEQMGNPQAAVFAEHLQKYQAGETGTALGGAPAEPSALLGGSVEADLLAGPIASPGRPSVAQGPDLLRMALSAAKAMAKFVGSGFKTVPAQTLRQRLETCAACEHHTGVRCRLCGCFTSAKARLPHEECPLGKWSS